MDIILGPQNTMGEKSPITNNITERNKNKINNHTKIF